METSEGTFARASKRRCLRRDKESTVCTPQKETSPRSFFPDSFLSPAVANTASHRPFSTARTSSSSADCGRVVERSVATPKTTSPYKSSFPSVPRHANEGADMAKQQFTVVQSLQDASQGSQSLVNALEDATDLALQTGDRQAELVALAENALKAIKIVSPGRNEKASAEGTDSSFTQASATLQPDHLVELLRQRQAMSAGCESRQSPTLYPENEDKPQESAFCKGQIIEEVDFLRLRGDNIQQSSWTSTTPGLSHYDSSPKKKNLNDAKNSTQAGEANSQLPSNPRDVLHLHASFQNTRSCRSASPERGLFLSHCVASGNENSAASTPFHPAVGPPHHRAEPSLASFAPLLCFSPETLPANLRVGTSTRPPPSASSPDVILQALRTLLSLTTPSRTSIVPSNFSVPAESSERDLSAASVETLSALLRPSSVPAATTTMTSSGAGLCPTPRSDIACEAQKAEASSSGGVHPAAQNLLYTLLMSCVTGQQRQACAERDGASTGTSSAKTAGRETRQYSALPNQQGGHPSHSRMLSTAQGLVSTPPHVKSSSSRVDLDDFENVTSSSADNRPESCKAAQGFGKTQHDDCSKDMSAVGGLGFNCSITGLLPKKSHSMDICRPAFEDTAQITPPHSNYSSLRRRTSLSFAADKEASPGGPRCATGEGTGSSRGRSRTDNCTRGDNTSKADSQTRNESTNRSGPAGRGRGRYAGVAAGAEGLASGSIGRGIGATAAGVAGCSQENQTGKPDVTLGGNRPHYHVAKQEWRVRYYLNGKRKMRTYSAKFYGYEAAHSMATDFAQYVDKNEALPHPVCKPVGLSGGRGAAGLSSVLASRALTAAAAARVRTEPSDAPLTTRHATLRHEHLAGQQPRPLLPWESSPAEAAKSLEALRLACSAGIKAGNCLPQQTQTGATARVNIGGCDKFSFDGEASPAVMRLGRLSRSSTPLLQASATPTDEEQSPYYEHSLRDNIELDRDGSSSRIDEMRDETAPQQKYCSLQEQQTTTPSPLTAVDLSPEITLANFLKSRKRRNPGVCCSGGPTTPSPPQPAVARPTVSEIEQKTNGTPGEVRLTRASRTPSGAADMIHSATGKPEQGKLAASTENAAGNAGAGTFIEGLQDNEKAYLSKLFSSMWTPVASQHPADVAPVRDRGGKACSLRRSSGSVASAAPRPDEIPATAVAAQARCERLLHRQETRCRPLQTNSPSISSPPENSSTPALLISRSNPYRALTEATAASHKASACSLAAELQERHAARSPSPIAGLSGEFTAEEAGIWVRENYSRGSRDTRGIPPGWTDFTGGGGRDETEAGATGGATAAGAAEATAPAAQVRTQSPMTLTSLVETDTERNVDLAPGHATAAMLAKTAMSQQMLDTVMLFDEFIRGFEKVFSPEQLQRQRRAILAPATCFAAEVSACLPSLTSPAVASASADKTNKNCDAASALSSSSSPTTAGDAGMLPSRSPSDSSVLRNVKDPAWFSREGCPDGDFSKQVESFVHTGTSLSASLASSQAVASAPAPHEGVSRVVTGLRLHLRSSELLVLSRVLVELTSSTYVLVTTLRATLASSTKIVQKYCEHLPPDGVQAKRTEADELSKDTVLHEEPGETRHSIARSNHQTEWAEIQQKGAERVAAAAGAHATEPTSKQPYKEEKYQQPGTVTHAEMAAEGVLVCFAAASGGVATSNLGSSLDRNKRDQTADLNEVLHTGTLHVETKAEEDTPVTEVPYPRLTMEAGSAANVALLKVAANEATVEEGENIGKQALQNGLVVDIQREELRPDEGASFWLKPKEQPVASKQTTLQAPSEMEDTGSCCSSSVADSSVGGSPRKQSKERSVARECRSAGLVAEQEIENLCQKNPKATQGDCHTAETSLKLASDNLERNGTNGILHTRAGEGEERAGQLTTLGVARDSARTAAAAFKQQGLPPNVAAEEGAAGARESSIAEHVAQRTELREKTIRYHRLQHQGGNDLRNEQRLRPQQHLPQFGATSLSAFPSRKDVASRTCTDNAAVLQGIVTLLQSQQRLVSVVRQLQASLPQYLRLIIRVAGHCFLPYKLPPATYFIKTRGPMARNNAPDAAAAATPAAAVRSDEVLSAALARGSAAKVREHELAEQPLPKDHGGCSLNEEEVSRMQSSGSVATAGNNTSVSRSVSLEAEEERARNKEKIIGELHQQDKAKPCAELPESLSSFTYLSRQSSVAGFPACGAVNSASSTEVEYSCSESPGLPGADTERKLSRDTAEDETILSSACKEGPSHGAARTELKGKKQWECAEAGFAGLAKAAAVAHYTLEDEDQRTATSVAGGPPLAGRTSPVPYVEVPGGRVIQDEAELEVFLLRPFQSSACGCQERPCPCDRQHIADLIHMLYTLPRPYEETDVSPLYSLPAASGDTCAPPHSADAGAAVPAIFPAPRGGTTAALSRSIEAASPHASARQQEWQARTTQVATHAAEALWVKELSGSRSDLSDAAVERQQRMSLLAATADELPASREAQHTRNSSSSSSVRFKPHGGVASSRTTSSGSSSSSSEPSVIGSDALMLVEESLRQVLFLEKLTESSNGSASSTHALPSASASPFCGSQTTNTPHTLLSAADTPGSASSCASSPFQRGLSAAAAAASSLLREAARQSIALAIGEEKRVATARDGKATPGAVTTTVKEDEDSNLGAGRRKRRPTGASSSTAENPTAALLVTSPASAPIRKVVGYSAAKGDAVASLSVSLPFRKGSLQVSAMDASEGAPLAPEGSSASGTEKLKERATLVGGDDSNTTLTDGARDVYRGRSSTESAGTRDCFEEKRAGTDEEKAGRAAGKDAAALLNRNATQQAPRVAERVDGDEEQVKNDTFEEALLGRRASYDATSADSGKRASLRSAPSTGAEGASAAGVTLSAEDYEGRVYSAPSLKSLGSGEEESHAVATEPTVAAAGIPYENVAADASGKTATGVAPVATAAVVAETQGDAQPNNEHAGGGGKPEGENQLPAATSGRKEELHKCDLAAAVGARPATCSADASCISYFVGGTGKLQQSREAAREAITMLNDVRQTRQQTAENQKQNAFAREGLNGRTHGGVGASDEAGQCTVSTGGAASEEERERRTHREEAEIESESRWTRCSLLQERQSLMQQEGGAALLNRSYPTVLASILPLQSLAHTIARLILHLHRQLVCRFIAAHARMLLNTPKSHGKANLTPALLQHLIRQLVETDSGRSNCSNSSNSRSEGNSSSVSDTRGPNNRCCHSGGEESHSSSSNSRGAAGASHGPAVAADKCASASGANALWDNEPVPDASLAATEAFAKTAAGSGRLGEEQSECLRKRSATAMLAHSAAATPDGVQGVVEQKGQGSASVCDTPGSSRRGKGAGGCPAEIGCLASPALSYASLLHTKPGDDVPSNVSRTGTRHSFHSPYNVTPAATTRMARADYLNTTKKERGERRGPRSCVTYTDVVRAAAAAVSAPQEATMGQQADLSLSRECWGATAAVAAAAAEKSAFPVAACASTEKAAAPLPACPGDAVKKEGSFQLSSADILDRVLYLSRPPAATGTGSACGFTSVEDTAEKVFHCQAAELSQFLVRAHALYASRGAGEQSAAAARPDFNAGNAKGGGVAESREDGRASLLAFPSSGEANSTGTGSCLH